MRNADIIIKLDLIIVLKRKISMKCLSARYIHFQSHISGTLDILHKWQIHNGVPPQSKYTNTELAFLDPTGTVRLKRSLATGHSQNGFEMTSCSASTLRAHYRDHRKPIGRIGEIPNHIKLLN